jgi:hypothetical protein
MWSLQLKNLVWNFFRVLKIVHIVTGQKFGVLSDNFPITEVYSSGNLHNNKGLKFGVLSDNFPITEVYASGNLHNNKGLNCVIINF